MTTQTLQIDELALERMQGAVERVRSEYEHLAAVAYLTRRDQTRSTSGRQWTQYENALRKIVAQTLHKLDELQSCERAVAAYLDACGVQQ